MAKKKKKIYNAITGEFETQGTTSKKSSTSSVSKGYDATKGSFYDIAPVKETAPAKKTTKTSWSNSLNDGYDFGDYFKTGVGKTTDFILGINKKDEEEKKKSVLERNEELAPVKNTALDVDTLRTRKKELEKQLTNYDRETKNKWWDKDDNVLENAGNVLYKLVGEKKEDKYVKDEKYDKLVKEYEEISKQLEDTVVKNSEYSDGAMGTIEKMTDTMAGNMMTGIRGIESTALKILGQTPDESVTSPNVLEKYSQKAREETSGIGRVGLDVLGGVSRMIPQMAMPGGKAATLVGFANYGGGAYNQAKEDGYSEEKATAYGVAIGGMEMALTHALGVFGNVYGNSTLGKASQSIIDKTIPKIISNKQVRGVLSQFAGEGLEEFVQEYVDAIAKDTLLDGKGFLKSTWENITDEELLADALYSALIGGITGSTMATPNAIDSYRYEKATGRDAKTGLTQNETNVVERVVENRIAEAEQNGNKLTNKQKEVIRSEVETDLKKGYISTNEIESVVEAAGENDTYLQESYNQKALKSVGYQYEASDSDTEISRQIKEDASKVMNNTNRSHEFVETVVKIANETGTKYRIVNNQSEEIRTETNKLANKDVTIDGYVNANGEVVINIDSPKALNRIVGHETTHVLEGTKEYSNLQKIALEYAKTKGEYESRLEKTQALYKGTNANINNEVTSDIVGDYLFTDQEFIKEIHTQDRNLFQKIYDEIKHLYKMATAGSKEARQLEKLKHSFEKAMNENKTSKTTTIESKSNLATEVESNTQEKGKQVSKAEETDTKYSLIGEKGAKEAVSRDNENEWLIKELNEAKALSKEGKSNEKIRRETGWFKDPNGKWLFEIPDNEIEINEAALKENHTTTLEELLPHEDLYEVYGDKLAKIKVITKNLNENIEGQYDDKKRIIYLNNSLVANNEIEKIRTTLLHEMQHIIQQIEGLEKGAEGKNPIKYYSSLGEIQATDVENRSRKNIDWLRENAPESAKEYPIHEQIQALHKALNSKKPKTVQKAQDYLKNDSRLKSLYDEIYNYGEAGVYNRKILAKMGITKNNAIQDTKANANQLLEEVGNWFNKKNAQDGKAQHKVLDTLFEDSTTDNKGRALTKEQEEFFKDSKVRDENGNLLTMYHGTSSGGHTVFDPWGAKVGLFGQGSYFTDNQSVAESYTEKGRGNNQQIYEVYLNITNPIDMDAQGDVQAWAKALSSYGTDIASHLESGTNEQIYRSALDYLAEEGTYDKYERAEIMAETFEKMGYDGITHIGGGRFNKQDGTRHRVYISLDSSQVKNVDNTNPTQDQDIRYSLSEDELKQKQLDIILKTNPMQDDYHTGIRTIEDIKTFDETINDDESFVWGDFSQEDAKKALKKGEITVYSSYPIGQGVFVSTSKNQAQDYAGEGKIYSKTVPLNDVAWINGDEGQYAKVDNVQYSLSEVPLEQRVTGDELLDAQDLIEELESVGAKIDENGYVTVYHATTQENARKINESKQMKSNEPAVFFSTSKNAQQSVGRGGTTLEFRIPVEKLVLDDLFSDNADVKIPLENFYTDTLDVTDYLVTNDYSLSNENTDIAPTSADIFGSEIKLQQQVQEAIAPLQETIQELNNKITTLQESIAPIEGFTDEDVSLKNDRNFESLENQNIAPIEDTTPEYQYENSNEETPINDPFKDRDIKEVGKRNVKAYMYENPEVKPYFQQAAREMLSDLDNSIKGEKVWLQEYNPVTGLMETNKVTGTQRLTTSDIADLLDNYKYTYAEIRKGLNDIIEDNGKENNAVSKRIEFMLHDRLMDGYTAVDGFQVPPSNEYRALIRDKDIQAYTDQAYQEWNSNINQDELIPIDNASNMNVEAENIPLESDLAPSNTNTPSKTNEPRIVNIMFADAMEAMTRQAGKQIQEGMTYKKSEPKVSPSKKQQAKNMFGKLQDQFVNRNYYIDKMARETGNNQIKFAGDMVNNFWAEIDGEIFTAQTDNNGNAIAPSLNSMFEPSRKGGYYNILNDYLMHYSNVDRHKIGKGSIVPLEYSLKMIAEYEKLYPNLKKEAMPIWKYGKNALANMESNGLISRQQNQTIQSLHPHWVPYAFDQEFKPSMSEDGTVRPLKAIKRAEGGAYEILEIEEALAKYTYRYKRAIRENSLYKEVVKSSNEKVSIGADVRLDPTNIEEGLGIDDKGKYYVTAYVDGQMKQATISEDLYNELTKEAEHRVKAIEERYELITKPLQMASEWKRNLLTTWSPTFLITNPIKDIQDAVLNSKYTGDFLKFYPSSFKELAQAKTKEAKQFLTLYGSGNTMGEYNTDTLNPKAKNNNFIKKLGNGVSKANNILELAPRFAEFKASLKNGTSVQEAVYNAREVTLNFGRGGYITKSLNRNGFTFLNASVQGFDKLVRNFSGENGAKGVVSSFAKVGMFALAPALVNALAFGTGDDEDEDYKALPDYIKDNYYLIKTEDGEFIRIPKGRMLSVFGSAGRRTLELLNGEKDAFEGYLTNAYSQVGVQNPLESNLFAPIIQAFGSEEGKTWYGTDLVPTRLQDKPAEEQYDETTDEFSKWLGGLIGVSPYKINYVLDQYSGGIGDLALPTITEEASSDGSFLAPIKDKFTANSTSDNKYVSEFYDKNNELKVKANSSKATEEDILKNKYMYSVSSEMSELYKEKREVQNDDTLTKTEKYERVQEIQKQINSLAEEGLDGYERLNKTSNYAIVNDREYYKNANDEWKSPYDDELDELNSLGMDIEEKSNYYDAKNSIYEITEKYKGTEDMYAEKKAEIIDVVKNSYLTDDQKGYLYSKYYAKEKTQIVNTLDMDFDSFLDLEKQNFVADKNAYGESISGSKKTKVFDYINSLNGLSFEEKVILAKLEYNSYDEFNYQIIDYLNNSNITYDEEVFILKKLGFVVDNEGNIYWK